MILISRRRSVMKERRDPRGSTWPSDLNLGHERRDVHGPAILKTGALLVVAAGLIHALVWWLYAGIQHAKSAKEQVAAPMIVSEASRPLKRRLQDIPLPRLEGL